ncbi:MAG: hypothetical protein HYX26_00840 [Acidobacteriales bacterium]|nr:hypothetical protein [Terriglobales bacterium]
MRKPVLSVMFVLLSAAAFAQNDGDDKKNELGLTIGAEIVPSVEANGTRLDFSSSVVFGVDYARRLKAGKNIALYLEVPFVAAPSHSVTAGTTILPPLPATPTSLATLFVTPGLRVKFARKSAFSPWVSFGGGYGLYEGSERLSNGAVNPDRFSSVGTLQWGGGVDIKTPLKILFPITLRGEVRDFYTLDSLNFNTGRGTGQHNVFVGGGIVLKF